MKHGLEIIPFFSYAAREQRGFQLPVGPAVLSDKRVAYQRLPKHYPGLSLLEGLPGGAKPEGF